MRSVGGLTLVIPLLGLAFACDSSPTEGENESGATGSVAAPLKDSAGILPYPIKVGAGNAPILSGGGKVTTTWGGSMADLLAADAWATCTQNATYPEQNDAYVSYLGNLIKTTANSCTTTPDSCPSGGSTCNVGAHWREIRTTKACNGYQGTGQTAALEVRQHHRDAYDLDTSPASLPRHAAQKELDVAEVNLCVAQKLREDMVSAPSLLMTAADQLELLAHVRERAQLSMLQYAVIAGALRAYVPGSTPQNQTDFGPALGAWAAKAANAGALIEFGADAAAAITMHVDASRELGKLLRQYTSSQDSAGSGSEWANGSWRARLTHLVYGGDPLGNYGAGKRWQIYGGSSHTTTPQFFGQVTENEESPQLQTLLGLARKADALYFYANPTTLAPDPPASAARLFQVVETSLREPSCTTVVQLPGCETAKQGDGSAAPPPPPPPYCNSPLPTCQLLVPQQQNLPTLEAPAGSLLQSKHGITPEHVLSLTRLLAQAMPRVEASDQAADRAGVFDFGGAHEFLNGGQASDRLPGAPAGAWYRISSDFELLSRGQQKLSDKVASLVDYSSTYASNAEYGPSRSFLGSTAKGNVAMRELGAVPALALSRDVFTEGARDAEAGGRPTKGFFKKAMTAMPFANAAAGDRSVSVRPVTATEATYPHGLADGPLRVERQLATSGADGSKPLWTVTVIAKKSDPYRNLVIAPDKSFIDVSAIDPAFRSFAGSSREVYFGASSGSQIHSPAQIDVLGVDDLERRLYKISGDGALFLTDAPALDSLQQKRLLPLGRLPKAPRVEIHTVHGSAPVPDVSSSSLPPPLPPGPPPTPPGPSVLVPQPLLINDSGRYMAYGGALGRMVEETWAVKSYNWSKPAFDGLGVKTDWFPPMTDLPDSAAGQPPSSYFIAKAKQAAAGAQQLATSLASNLIEEQRDANIAEDAQVAAVEAEKSAKFTLCGANANSPDDPYACDVNVVDLNLLSEHVIDPTGFCQLDFCKWYDTLRDQAFPATLPVLAPVRDAVLAGQIDSPAAPTFSQYSGGVLQGTLNEQWVALRRVHETMREFQSFLLSGATMAATAEAKLNVLGQMVALDCSDSAFSQANLAGFSFSLKKGENANAGCTLESDGSTPCQYVAAGRTFNPGPFYAQLRACEQQKLTLAVEQQEAAGVLDGMYTKMYGYLVQAHQAGDDVRRATIDALRAANEAKLAAAKAKFESQRVDGELRTRFDTYRRFHIHDAGGARAEVERARLLSLYARRALEADYVVDLSTIYSAGPLVTDPPAYWADKVYEPSLDLTALMNFDVDAEGDTSTGGADWFTQYVQKLDHFRLDYVLSNYNMTVNGINQLVELPAPEKLVEAFVPGRGMVNVVSDDVAAWTFYCPDTQAWRPHPLIGEPLTTSALPTLCDGKSPTKAKFTFALDPWGRLDGNPYEQGDGEELRYNMRAMQFAVNLEGAGITTCADSGCTPPADVIYNLSQYSPAWLSDLNQDLHAFDVNIGRAINASALATRHKVVLVSNDFDSGEIADDLANANVRRTELFGRPLGAAYELEFKLTNSVRIENVKNVQLLFKHSYWQ
jgi:hypothetical protein